MTAEKSDADTPKNQPPEAGQVASADAPPESQRRRWFGMAGFSSLFSGVRHPEHARDEQPNSISEAASESSALESESPPSNAHPPAPLETEAEPQSQPEYTEPETPFEPVQSEAEIARAELRAKLIGQFESWLDQALEEEPPPSGLPVELLAEATAITNGQQPPGEPDLFTVFSSLTGLTGEIRLQGRAFKQLSDLVTPLSIAPDLLTQLLAAQPKPDESQPIPFSQICEVLIDLYDRLQRGLQTCDEGIKSIQLRQKTGLAHRLLDRQIPIEQAILSARALRDSAALTLARLQSALHDWGVRTIGKVGDPFDPQHMMAVEVRIEPTLPAGTILSVNRSGYAIGGVVKSTAQVTVSKTSMKL